MHRNATEWEEQYRNKRALSIHDGDPLRPHFRLHSGLHSNGFFNSRPLIADDRLLWEAAADLVEKLDLIIPEQMGMVEGVIGPQTGATKLAEFLRNNIMGRIRRQGFDCFWASPSKQGSGDSQIMVFTDGEIEKIPGKMIILCEDVVTTGDSISRTMAAIDQANGLILPYILCLVNRSGLKEVRGNLIVSLIDVILPRWTPKDCLLCQQGSQAITKDEWDQLSLT